MAVLARIPAAHREYAPDDNELVRKLPQAELNLRAETVHHLHDTAGQIGEKDIADATRSLADKIRDAMPKREFDREVKRRQDIMASLPHGEERLDLQLGHQEALNKLKDQHRYPAGLDRVLDQAEVPVAKTAPGKQTLSKAAQAAIVEKAVAKARTDLDVRVRQLRAEIEAFKKERGIK